MAFHSPYLLAFKLVENAGEPSCELLWNEAFGESTSFANYALGGFVVCFYIPMVLLIIFSQSIIVIKLKSQKIPGEHPVNAEQQRAKRERKVLKMAIAIVTGFALCFLPWSIIIVLDLRGIRLHCGNWDIVRFVVSLMPLLNGAINPCICFTFSGNYRRGLKRLLMRVSKVQE